MIHEHIKTFKLTKKTNDELKDIQECIMNKYYFQDLLNYNRLIKVDEITQDKIYAIEKESFKVKSYNTVYHKIKLINEICKLNNMKLLSLEKTDESINFSNDLHNKYKAIFNAPKSKQPKNNNELIKLLVNSYKNIMPSLNLINTKSTQLNINGKRLRKYEYTFKTDVLQNINKILSIYGFVKGYDLNEDVLDFIDYEKPDEYDDDDDDYDWELNILDI
jgi:hypothetical protein